MVISHKKDSKKFYNHLKNEKSPYLIQHADNPVNWYPWGDEAFKKAEKEDKPIFLSIGYSTCHWCHVMAKESFEDLEVGELINKVFVAVKVDREERPDLDSIYMNVCQLMTGTGGWPLTVIMTPDKKPFFAGTYFPKESGYGNVGLKDLILNVGELWEEKREELLNSGDQVLRTLKDVSSVPPGEGLNPEILDRTYESLSKVFDYDYGGFGDFQKFPTPHNLMFLLRYWKRTKNRNALYMVEKTLNSMYMGGIYDHIGFGFHRYSVDPGWLIPHFEKMLYDQALISMAYIEAFQATGSYRYKKIAEEIFEYVLRDMKSPDGGFYSAEDADSEGVEGKFYLWTKKEVSRVLSPDESKLICEVFNIKEEGNFSSEVNVERGANIFHLKGSIGKLTEKFGISGQELEVEMEKSMKKLFKARDARIHPKKDDKILADWNGLMVAAFALAARVFDGKNAKKYLKAAEYSANFILDKMYDGDRLFHRYRDGEAAVAGNLEDYAFMIWGLLELYETSFRVEYLKKALKLNETLIEHFWDESGGFYFTADDAEKTILREKKSYDSALPSGNSVEMLNLIKIARITGNSELEMKAELLERAFSTQVWRSPTSHTQLMEAFDFKVGPSYDMVVVGDEKARDTREMIQSIQHHFIPNKILILKNENARAEGQILDLLKISESLKYKKSIEGMATAYVCTGGTCKSPTTNVNEILNILNAG